MTAIAIVASKHCVCTYCKQAYINKRRRKSEGNKYCSRECAYAMKALKAQAPYSKVVFNSCVVCSKAWAAKRAKSICSPGCGNEKAMQTYRAWYEKEVESRPLKKCKQCDTFQNYPLSVFCLIECNGKLISLALD